jgi:secondary thiamine-phosphate synthase enzyme
MIATRKLDIESQGNTDIIDITGLIEDHLAASGLKNGTVTVFVPSTTAAVAVMEDEPGLLADFKAYWERTVPKGINYDHHKAWGEYNGHSHVRTTLLGLSLVIPFADSKMMLGTWQQVLFFDFDIRPRTRQVILQIMGE